MNYGVRFEGYINVEADGFYRFAMESDDGSVLRIDDEVVIDNDGDHGPRLVAGHIPLRRGLHKHQPAVLPVGRRGDAQRWFRPPRTASCSR